MAMVPVGSDELRGLALRTLFPGFDGPAAPSERLGELIEAGLGGVVLFGRNIDPERRDAGIAALTARLRMHREDLLIATDEEGGDVTRLDVTTGSDYPGSAALGAADDPDLTRDVAASLAGRLRACGIDINFAPVADVDVDPRNPIIGVRAFGAEPGRVARHVTAFVEGHQSRGVIATVKHFPGHGATAEDSHVTVPVIEAPQDVLDRRELVPFRAAVAAGARLVMTAHIRVTAVDRELPATLSPAVVTGMLRETLGYTGAVITDGMDMHAISRTVGLEEGAVLALLAGVDAICVGGETTDPGRIEAIAGAIVTAVTSGRLSYERLAEAADRVRVLAEFATSARVGNGAAATSATNRDGSAAVRAAQRAVVARGDVRLRAAPLVLELQVDPSIAAGQVPWGVGAPLVERLPDTVVVPIHEPGPRVADLLARYPDRPVVIGVRGVRRLPWQLRVVGDVRALRPGAVVVDHGLSDPAQFDEPYVLTFGASRVTADAAAELLAPMAAGHPTAARLS